MSENKFEIFKEINIGGLEKEQLIRRLSEAGIQFNKYAHALFEHPQFSPPSEVEKVSLVKVTLSDLGLNDTCSAEKFSNRAAVLGLKLCPLYLAAFLRLEYLNQPDGPY
ncbi:MAG: helicase, partial [Bdellovibrionales bacterium]